MNTLDTLENCATLPAHSQLVPHTPPPINGALWGQIEAACEQACRHIAPAWPLDRAIAVNPHWSRIGRPVR